MGKVATFMLLILCVQSGCAAPDPVVTVVGLHVAGDRLPSVYAIRSGSAMVGDNELEFRECSQWVEAALRTRGLRVVNSIENAESVVLVTWDQQAFDVEDPVLQTKKLRAVYQIELVAVDVSELVERKTTKYWWKLDAFMFGNLSGIRGAIPLMMGAAAPYIGTETLGLKDVKLGKEDIMNMQDFAAQAAAVRSGK